MADGGKARYIYPGGGGPGGGEPAKYYQLTLPATDWTGEQAPFTQEKEAKQITENDTAICALQENTEENRKELMKLTSVTSKQDFLTFTAKEKPILDLGLNILAIDSKKIEITPPTPSVPIRATFNEYSPAELTQISAMGAKDETIWEKYNLHIGDRHAIDITGTVNGIDLTGTWYAMIIGFNHNSEKEGTGITLQFANNTLTDGNNLVFVSYQINTSNINVGGWENSIMRTVTCIEFFNALPKEWQDIIKTTIKHTDNQGNGNDNNPITATEDKIFIPSEFEIFGKRKNANSHEESYQLQYDYYKIDNTKKRYSHDKNNFSTWWLRSPFYKSDSAFCAVAAAAAGAIQSAEFSTRLVGFSPCMVV